MKNIHNYKHYLIIDVEATCCNKNSISRNDMEIIEIGAVIIDAKTLNILDEFESFVRPIKHPLLTSFCKSLTSIKQCEINKADIYPIVIKKFKKWLDLYDDFLFCSWGSFDKKQFLKDSILHDINDIFTDDFLDLKIMFYKTQNLKKKYSMDEALNLINQDFLGTRHRALNDAKNSVKLLPYILNFKKISENYI